MCSVSLYVSVYCLFVQIYATIEDLKNGSIQSAKYGGRQIFISPPQIVILSNKRPTNGVLSRDRLELLTVTPFNGVARLVSLMSEKRNVLLLGLILLCVIRKLHDGVRFFVLLSKEILCFMNFEGILTPILSILTIDRRSPIDLRRHR